VNMLDIEQGSDAWRSARMGKVTASRVADLMAKTKSGYGASRKNYMAQLVCERMTGAWQDSYTNSAMQWGVEKEPEAKAAYSFFTGNNITAASFVPHPAIPDAGASPDGYVGEDGLIECKCPLSATHIETLLSQSVDSRYVLQIQFQLACTGRKWCDFVSFDPRMPPELSLFVKRIDRDQKMIDELQREVLLFLNELNETINKLNTIKEAA